MFFSTVTVVSACLMASLVNANWDPATGHLRDYGVKQEWLDAHKPAVVTKDIQASECAINTRLHYPDVQLFALFRVNHEQDNYHGCPYGDCWAFTASPSPSNMIATYTDEHAFFWHNTGGLPSTGVKAITDPQTGAYGYEESLSGHFKDGAPDTSSLQLNHDKNYPTFSKLNLTRWSQQEINQFTTQKKQPMHPKCGAPCGPNRDPGSNPGAYGNYHPASASAYSPPPTWQPGPKDQCFHNGSYSGGGNTSYTGSSGGSSNDTSSVPTKPGNTNSGKKNQPVSGGSSSNGTYPYGSPQNSTNPKHSSGNHCKKFCKCIKKCQGDSCDSCDSTNTDGCSQKDCNASNHRSRKAL